MTTVKEIIQELDSQFKSIELDIGFMERDLDQIMPEVHAIRERVSKAQKSKDLLVRAMEKLNDI